MATSVVVSRGLPPPISKSVTCIYNIIFHKRNPQGPRVLLVKHKETGDWNLGFGGCIKMREDDLNNLV